MGGRSAKDVIDVEIGPADEVNFGVTLNPLFTFKFVLELGFVGLLFIGLPTGKPDKESVVIGGPLPAILTPRVIGELVEEEEEDPVGYPATKLYPIGWIGVFLVPISIVVLIVVPIVVLTMLTGGSNAGDCAFININGDID